MARRNFKSGADAAAPQRPPWAWALALSALSFLTFLPSLSGGLLNWDDDLYVTDNPELRSPGLHFVKWASTAVVAGLWHPLTLASLALDHAFWGLDPRGYHLTNIILHALNTGLVFLVAARLPGAGRLAALFAACFFGLHPLRVESVAWVSERKEVLCAFFYLSSILAYLGRDARAGARGPYGLSIFLFALSLSSKPMAVSLPVTLLILDYLAPRETEAGRRWGSLLLEKLPFIGLSLLASGGAFWSQAGSSALVSAQDLPWPYRLAGAARAAAFYMEKTLLPRGLAPFYPWPARSELLGPELAAALALVLAVSFYCVSTARKNKVFLAAWLFYLASLLPVSGIAQVGSQFAADRYTYLPCLGPAVLLGAGFAKLHDACARAWLRAALLGLALCAFVLLAAQTARQQAVWKDSVSLWSREVLLYPKSALGRFKLGTAFKGLGLSAPAARELGAAVELAPDDAQARVNLGSVLAGLGRAEEAAAQFREALKLKPADLEARNDLGAAYLNLGRAAEASREFSAAVRLKPDFPEAHFNLGLAFMRSGKLEAAIKEYSTAASLRPGYREAHNNLGQAFMGLGRAQEAAAQYELLLRLNPDDPVAHFNLGAAFTTLGRTKEARAEFEEAVRLDPDFPQARRALGKP